MSARAIFIAPFAIALTLSTAVRAEPARLSAEAEPRAFEIESVISRSNLRQRLAPQPRAQNPARQQVQRLITRRAQPPTVAQRVPLPGARPTVVTNDRVRERAPGAPRIVRSLDPKPACPAGACTQPLTRAGQTPQQARAEERARQADRLRQETLARQQQQQQQQHLSQIQQDEARRRARDFDELARQYERDRRTAQQLGLPVPPVPPFIAGGPPPGAYEPAPRLPSFAEQFPSPYRN